VWEHGGEMTKVLYAHMNNKTIKKKRKGNVVFMYNGTLFSLKEEWNFVICK
jgi:hypothetical protein